MNLTLQRLFLTPRSTCGELSVDGNPARFSYTLELPVKDGLPGSAIPPGRYPIQFQPSPKFLKSDDPWVQKYAAAMPHIICPPRSLIMFHWGNDPENTDGCVLLGFTHDLDFIGESRPAFEKFYNIIEGPVWGGDCWVTVQGGMLTNNSEAVQDAVEGG